MIGDFGIHSTLVVRSGAIKEMERILRESRERAEQIIKELLAAAPEDMRSWIENEGLLETLLQYGQANTKIRFGEEGFGDLADVQAKLSQLRKAWRYNAVIRACKPESHRIEIYLYPARPADPS